MFVLLSCVALAVPLNENFELFVGQSVTLNEEDKEIEFLLEDISQSQTQPEVLPQGMEETINNNAPDYIAKFTVFYENEEYEIAPWLNNNLPRNFGQYKVNFLSFDGSETGTFRIEKLVYDIDELFQNFNSGNYHQGLIEVYFQPGITLQEAVEVVESLDLEIVKDSSCPLRSASYNPQTGGESVDTSSCDDEDLYHWSSTSFTEGSFAKVNVPVGQEKHFAEELINNDEVIFVKPSANVVHPDIASINEEEPIIINDESTEEIGFFQRLANWFKNLF